MKHRSNRRQLRLITEISITPLLNLVFVLLLVFMVAAPLLKNEVSLMLPAVSGTSAHETPPDMVVTLTVDQARTLTLDGRAVERAELAGALKQFIKVQPDAAVMVQIHRDLPVQSLVEIMDELNGAGVRKTSVVATQPAHQ